MFLPEITTPPPPTMITVIIMTVIIIIILIPVVQLCTCVRLPSLHHVRSRRLTTSGGADDSLQD